MELPTNQLKFVSYEKILPDLSEKGFCELKKSIEKWGIIEPIVVNQNNVIICGKERYRAALTLGIEKVPVVIRKTNLNAELEIISIEENLRRRHLTPPEKAKLENISIKDNLRSWYHTISKKAKEIKTFYESKEIEKNNKTRMKNSNSKKAVTKQVFKYRTIANLIPELCELLDEGKINHEVAEPIRRCLTKTRRRYKVF